MTASAFTGTTIDRASELRSDPARLAEVLDDPRAVVVAAAADEVLVDPGESSLARRPAAAQHRGDGAVVVLLGLEGGAPVIAVDLGDPQRRADLLGGGALIPLREAGTRLSQAEGGLAAYLVALLGWHRRHGFCANCGAPTAIAEAGLSRRCPRCSASHFPRTDPVVIMRVEHRDRLLLGRRAGWPEGRYSVLAGFVAPGETPEEAVVREVAEESGILACQPRYVAAQPWPFPASLMLAFEAGADGGSPTVGDRELEDVAWFDREEVAAAARRELDPDGNGNGAARLLLPPPVSIARDLIDRWLARG